MHRDAAWVEREFGQEKWPEMLRRLEQLSRTEPQPLSLARVIGQLTRLEVGAGGSPTQPGPAVVDGHRVKLPAGVSWAAEQALVVETVLEATTPATDAVIELGSGWGHNLFRLWLEGGPAAVRYVAAEYTQAGRNVAQRIGELEPGMRLEVRPFDYHRPEGFSCGRLREAIVFTVNSIEQIPTLTPAVVTAIAGIAERVRCFHFEPVGWQIDPTSTCSSRGYAERHDYNRNLITLLQEADSRGLIELQPARPEIFGTNPENATTLLAWSAGA